MEKLNFDTDFEHCKLMVEARMKLLRFDGKINDGDVETSTKPPAAGPDLANHNITRRVLFPAAFSAAIAAFIAPASVAAAVFLFVYNALEAVTTAKPHLKYNLTRIYMYM